MTTSIEGYTILDVIGRGGTAVVYRARQEEFDREVAVKVFEVDVEDEQSRRIVAELRALGRLAELHEAIAVVFSSGITDQGHPYLSMRHYMGGSLRDEVRRNGPLSLIEVSDIATTIGAALDVAHANGVVHRDVKPANILLDLHHRPVLTDFGIASGEVLGSDTTGMAMLTPAYAAPERLDGEAGGPASDIYSLTATLWTLLVGRAPHAATESDSIGTLVRRAVAGEIQSALPGTVPAAVEEVLRAGLSVDPALRPGSASQLAEALSDAVASSATNPWSSAPTGSMVLLSDDDRTRDVSAIRAALVPPPVQSAAAEVDFPMEAAAVDGGASVPERAAEVSEGGDGSVLLPPTSPSRYTVIALVAALVVIGVAVALLAHQGGKSTSLSAAAVRVRGATVERQSTTTAAAPTTSSTTLPNTSIEPNTTTQTTLVAVPGSPAVSTTSLGTPRVAGAGAASGPIATPTGNASRSSTTIAQSNPAPAPAPAPAQAPAPTPTTPKPQRITCSSITDSSGYSAPIQFVPGLAWAKAPQTFVMSNATQLKGCTDDSGRGITFGTVTGVKVGYGAINCYIGAGNGTGTGQISWSDGESSNVTLRIDIQAVNYGTSTWTITSGPFAGSSGKSNVTIILGQDTGFLCSNVVTYGGFQFQALTLSA